MAENRSRPAIGRRPGETQTRGAILEAAECRFAEAGYAASLRSIARDAGVDPALIGHFFGSKAGLFIAAVRWPIDPAETLDVVLSRGPENAGSQLAAMFLRHWGEAENRSPILALIAAAQADAEAALLLRRFLLDRNLLPILEALGSDRRPLRAGLISGQLAGLGLSRYVYGMINPDEYSEEEIAKCVAPVLQHYLTESLE
jgi:AcrR family transcriptional regulator